MMLTTDIALASTRTTSVSHGASYENPAEFADAFARAWYKLTHRDMGPLSRYLGPLVPAEKLLWQDPVPDVDHPLIGDAEIAALKAEILASGLSTSRNSSRTAWASASSFRGSDKRGGANGARIRLEPQKNWEVNQPAELATVLAKLEQIKQEFDAAQSDGKKVSLADLIVLGGVAAVEEAAKKSRPQRHRSLRSRPHGRVARADRRRDVRRARAERRRVPQLHPVRVTSAAAAELLVDRANLLTLTAPEMTVLVGGMRRSSANFGGTDHGVFTKRPGALTNDFFVNLLDMSTKWQPSDSANGVLEGRDRKTGEHKWTGTVVDLVFGSNSQLRALAEVYGASDAQEKFVDDFVAAWNKVMNLDRFDLK